MPLTEVSGRQIRQLVLKKKGTGKLRRQQKSFPNQLRKSGHSSPKAVSLLHQVGSLLHQKEEPVRTWRVTSCSLLQTKTLSVRGLGWTSHAKKDGVEDDFLALRFAENLILSAGGEDGVQAVHLHST